MRQYPILHVVIAAGLFAPASIQSQTKPAFEVASVKLSETPIRPGFHFGPDSVNLTSFNIGSILILAFGVREFQIQGPDWVVDPNSPSRFTVVAKASGPVPEDQLRLMLRNLLTDRFHLTLHHEQKEMAVLALRPARSGAKLKPSAGAVPPYTQWEGFAGVSYTGKEFVNGTAESLAAAVAHCTGRSLPPVVDQTGLRGRFDFTAPRLAPPPPPDSPALSDEDRLAACDLIAQQDVGMTLSRAKGPVDILVVDHADKVPTEN